MSEYITDIKRDLRTVVCHIISKYLYFEISYSQPPIITMHFKETGLKMQKGVFLCICFIHCNSQLDISKYIYMYNKNTRSKEIYKTCLIMHVFNTNSTPELHTGAIHPVTVYTVGSAWYPCKKLWVRNITSACIHFYSLNTVLHLHIGLLMYLLILRR